MPSIPAASSGALWHGLVKTNMVAAGIDEIYRDTLLGHSKKGMDVHYIHPEEKTLIDAMNKYTAWLNNQLEFVDHAVDQNK